MSSIDVSSIEDEDGALGEEPSPFSRNIVPAQLQRQILSREPSDLDFSLLKQQCSKKVWTIKIDIFSDF